MVNDNLKQRFLKYISFDTQSDDQSNTIPSTMKQKDLGKYLEEELKSIGLTESFMDEVGYVYGYLPSNCNSNQTIGLIAHMDTSDEASGKDVNPNIIKNYDGSIIVLNEALGLKLDPKEFNYLNNQIGHELITTDAGKVENDYSVVDDLTEPLLDVAYIMIDEADNTQVKTREDFIKGIDNLFGSFDWVNEVVLLALNPLSGQLQKNTNQQ